MDLRKSDILAGTSYWIEDIQKIYIYIYFWVPKISHNFWIIFQFSPVFTGLKAPNIFHGKDESGEGKEQLLVEESMDPHIVLSLDDDFLAGCLATGSDPLNGPKGYISMVYIPYIPQKIGVVLFTCVLTLVCQLMSTWQKT